MTIYCLSFMRNILQHNIFKMLNIINNLYFNIYEMLDILDKKICELVIFKTVRPIWDISANSTNELKYN